MHNSVQLWKQSDGIDIFLGYVLPSLVNQIPAFRSAKSTMPQKQGLVTLAVTRYGTVECMYELTTTLFQALGIV